MSALSLVISTNDSLTLDIDALAASRRVGRLHPTYFSSGMSLKHLQNPLD
jgi:hypothetical protein